MRTISIIALAILFTAIQSCEKRSVYTTVTYQITGLADTYEVTFLDENEQSVSTTVNPANEDFVWSHSFRAKPGTVLYLYAEYYNEDIDPQEFRFRILLNDKVFKEAVSYDKDEWVSGEHVFYIKRTGTVPFEI